MSSDIKEDIMKILSEAVSDENKFRENMKEISSTENITRILMLKYVIFKDKEDEDSVKTRTDRILQNARKNTKSMKAHQLAAINLVIDLLLMIKAQEESNGTEED